MKYAIKVFENEEFYERELQINRKLLERFDKKIPSMFIQQVFCRDENKAIVYKPVGKKLEKMRLTKRHVMGIFDAVGYLHKLGIIHRDLSPNHIFEVNFIQFI